MPFYPATDIKKINSVTLQVQCPFFHPGKRVLCFTSFDIQASMTVEAALCLSLFVFAVVLLMLPMRMIDSQRKVQAVLEAAGEDLARLSYVRWKQEQGKEGVSEEYGNYMEAAATDLYLVNRIYKAVGNNRIDQVIMLHNQILQDGQHVRLAVSYRLRFPFSVFGIQGIELTSQSYKRAWIGRDGGKNGGIDGEGNEGPMVYVGKSMGRYHLYDDCHYLDNQLTGVLLEQVGTYQNKGGEYYRPCSVCGHLAQRGDQVFLMPSGSSYHSKQSCSAIIAYVKVVPLSQVAHLGACSYCTKRK